MKKILVISPHFSTGGAPQVTLNKVRLLKDHFKIKVVEYSFLSWKFVVQRDAIRELVGENNFITLSGSDGEKHWQLMGLIDEFKPDIISMEEFPEMFMPLSSSAHIYSSKRGYKITETTHDSSFPIAKKNHMPDKFIFVSAYNAIKYSHLKVPIEIIEYPVDKQAKNGELFKNSLLLPTKCKHVVIIGLFTPRKNQAYAFKLASMLKDYNIMFHFLGNQAENFEHYWKPLMESKPENCVVWGERSDVDDFIQSSDLFLFPSKGDRGNKELNPIVIKEAAQYENLPKLMFNLDVYLNKYSEDDSFHFLSGDANEDSQKIVNLTNAEIMKELIIIGTYPNLKMREQLTISCINSLKPLGIPIMLVSHYPVSQEIQGMVDYYVFDAENLLTHHSYYTKFYNYRHDYDVDLNINGLRDSNQSLTVLTNLNNAFRAAKSYGFSKAFYITYDVEVKIEDYDTIIKSFDAIGVEGRKAYLATLNTPFGHGIQTTAMTFDVKYFLDSIPNPRTSTHYNEICSQMGCQNFLEDFMMKIVKRWDESTYKLITNEQQTFLVHSGLGVSSNSEYYSILPVEGIRNEYMFYFFTYNVDERKVQVTYTNGNEKLTHIIDIMNCGNGSTREYKFPITYMGRPIEVRMDFYDGGRVYKTETYEMNDGNLSKYQHTGSYRIKNKKPKIKLVHLQTDGEFVKEAESYSQLLHVSSHGWDYVLHQNPIYRDLPPKERCMRPNCVSMELFDHETTMYYGTALTPAHYGCYESFKNAILAEFDSDVDYLIVCEGDCKIIPPLEEFVEKVEKVCGIIKNTQIGYVSFGDKATLEQGWLQSPVVREIPNQDLIYVTNHIIGLQCIMFPQKAAKWLKSTLRTHPWDAADMYFNSIFRNSDEFEMAIVHQRLTTQFDGWSLIDNQEKKFI